MENGRSGVKGWRDFEAPSPSKTEEASQAPTTKTFNLTWRGVFDAIDSAISRESWGRFEDGKSHWNYRDLDAEQRQKVLQAVLGELPLSVDNVKRLFNELHATLGPHGGTLAGSFKIVVQVAGDWLRERNALPPEEPNNYARSFMADLAERDR